MIKKQTAKRRTAYPRFGPRTVPSVPITQFKKYEIAVSKLEEVWELIAPSFELNVNRLPLWKVITMAYLEGVLHGSQMKEEEMTNDFKR